MANTSILAAFERMWQHVNVVLSNKSDINHTHNPSIVAQSEPPADTSALWIDTSDDTVDEGGSENIPVTAESIENALGYTPTSEEKVQELINDAGHLKQEDLNDYVLKSEFPTASASTLGGVKIGSNINISNGKISVPTASGTSAGVTIVYPSQSCTTYTSDTGTITPLAAQKAAKMFAITRPASSTVNAITRYSNTAGDVADSKIIIEDVVNSKDSSKKAQVIAIPAEGNKKMVYGYCTDQVDGTSFIGGVFDKDATSYPYSEGLAIGGTSGNLLWKGAKVATVNDIPSQTSIVNSVLAALPTWNGGSY